MRQNNVMKKLNPMDYSPVTFQSEIKESMLEDWQLLDDNKLVEDLLREFESKEIELDAEEEETAANNLITLLAKPKSRPLVLKCLQAFIGIIKELKTINTLTSLIYDCLLNPETRAAGQEALFAIVSALPPIGVVRPDSFPFKVSKLLLELILDKVIQDLSPLTLSYSLPIVSSLLASHGLIIRSYTKYKNICFIQDKYLCTGIVLGSGSYANVFLGYNTSTAQKCALKIMDWEKLTRGQPKLKEQLENEISVMRASTHPNIVTLYDVMQSRDLILVLEYCSGGDMDNYLKRHGGRLPEQQVLHWLRQLSEGLKFLRSKGLVHRDLKPGNLLLSSETTEDGKENITLKITDFTFARFVETGSLITTLVGTPLYMAPEIFFKRIYDDKADLWSLGVIIYQMLIGEMPYKGEGVMELIINIQRTEAEWPKGIEVSPELKKLVEGLLKKDPEQRMEWDEFFDNPLIKPEDQKKLEEENKKKKEQERVEKLERSLEELKKSMKEINKQLEEEKSKTEKEKEEKEEVKAELEEMRKKVEEEREENSHAMQELEERVKKAEKTSDTYARLLSKAQMEIDELRMQANKNNNKMEKGMEVLRERIIKEKKERAANGAEEGGRTV